MCLYDYLEKQKKVLTIPDYKDGGDVYFIWEFAHARWLGAGILYSKFRYYKYKNTNMWCKSKIRFIVHVWVISTMKYDLNLNLLIWSGRWCSLVLRGKIDEDSKKDCYLNSKNLYIMLMELKHIKD